MTQTIPTPRLLMGPGPSGVSPDVLKAIARPPIGYLDPVLFEILNGIRANLRDLFGTKNAYTLPLTGTGMAAMECCLVNVIEPGDRVVIGVHGFFGSRMVEICRRIGADVTVFEAEWGTVLREEQCAEALNRTPDAKLVACVHAETSTGVLQPLEGIAQLAHENGALFLVDAVTSLGGLPVDVDRVGIDVCYSGSQKCIGAPPGLAPLTVSGQALEAAAQRRSVVPSWYYDWKLLGDYFDGSHLYHHTVPVNLYFALEAALTEAVDEGFMQRYARHQKVSDYLMNELAEIDIHPFAEPAHRLPMLNAVHVPEHVNDEAEVRRQLLNQYGIEIGGGLGALKDKIWRIGTMGFSATVDNVTVLIRALRAILKH